LKKKKNGAREAQVKKPPEKKENARMYQSSNQEELPSKIHTLGRKEEWSKNKLK
jgi:hypothetical protein